MGQTCRKSTVDTWYSIVLVIARSKCPTATNDNPSRNCHDFWRIRKNVIGYLYLELSKCNKNTFGIIAALEVHRKDAPHLIGLHHNNIEILFVYSTHVSTLICCQRAYPVTAHIDLSFSFFNILVALNAGLKFTQACKIRHQQYWVPVVQLIRRCILKVSIIRH